jgi:hypothetical protein
MDFESLTAALLMRLSTDPLLDIVLALLFVSFVTIFLLSRRVSALTRGQSGASLESTITSLATRVEALEGHGKTTEVALNNIDERLQSALRGVSVRRYDPFDGAGGQQSFSTALLNETGDGIVLSGIHARDSVRVYAKEVTAFQSDRELSDDEAQSIADAKKRLQ